MQQTVNITEGGFVMNETFLLNDLIEDNDKANENIGWVKQNTAILVVHGMGFQLPVETLDQFGRGLIKQYKKRFGETVKLKHEIVVKSAKNGKPWFDNVLRITKEGEPSFIDIYEYYWANYTEDKASFSDINKWVQGVAKGARKFYKRNKEFGQLYEDKSIFFQKNTGKFLYWRYRFFLISVTYLLFVINFLIKFVIGLVSLIPLIGRVATSMLEGYKDSLFQTFTNFLVDLVAYNVVDAKSKFYVIREQVLDGATSALQYLLEKTNKKGDHSCSEDIREKIKSSKDDAERKFHLEQLELTYPSVIVAAHSLGTQISYDAINRINLMVNKEEICTYDNEGKCITDSEKLLCSQLNGFVTFGSPLDKVLFFLRENIPDEYYLRQQVLDHYYGFKSRANNSILKKGDDYVKAECGLKSFLNTVKWRNYYDDKDYVSGGLDYYSDLKNINCQFDAGRFTFTHSYYWDNEKFFLDIINHYFN